MTGYKRLAVPAEAVRTVRALTGTPLDIARTITRGLSTEARSRELRSNELRRALSLLSEDRILPEQTPTVRAVVRTLLRHNEPIHEDVLVSLIDKTKESVENNSDGLVGLRLVDETHDYWRVCLAAAYDEPEEWPESTDETWSVLDSLYGLAIAALPPPALSGGHLVVDRLHQPGVPSLTELAELWDVLDRWIDVVRAVEGTDTATRQLTRLGSANQTAVS